MTALRILHLRTVRGTGGGPDKGIFNAVHFLRSRGHHAEAFYILDVDTNAGVIHAAGKAECPVHQTIEHSAVSPTTVRNLHRVLAAGRYDVVHTHEYKSNALATLLRPFHHYRIVATAHGYNRTTGREAFYYTIERILLRYVDAVVAPTHAMHRQLCRFGVPPAKLHVIHNGIHITDRPPPPLPRRNGQLHVLYLGRLSREKDPANLIDALAILRQRGRRIHTTIAGDGPERQDLLQRINERHLGAAVRLIGFVSDVGPLLRDAHLVVCPSRTECMPNAVLEAMHAGRPVVATRVGGLNEMIRHNTDGLLCPPRDPAALAHAIGQIDDDGNLARTLADNARRRVAREFAFAERMQLVIDLYRQVLYTNTRGSA